MKCKPLLIYLLAAFAALSLAACDQDLVIDPEFSVNVFNPGPKYPNVKKLTTPQKEVFEKHGKPDHFKVQWDKRGTLKTRAEVEPLLARAKPKNLPPYNWIYLDKNLEISFTENSYEELPLSDMTRMLTKHGDPEDVKELHAGIIQWMYFSVGKQYKFNQGRLVETKEFPALGKFQKP